MAHNLGIEGRHSPLPSTVRESLEDLRDRYRFALTGHGQASNTLKAFDTDISVDRLRKIVVPSRLYHPTMWDESTASISNRSSVGRLTLTQFLGQLERIDAAAALMPALVPDTAGQITDVDGHMIAYWSRVPMHKGKITMLGRIMAGSQAIIAHNEGGQALFVR